MNELWKLMNYKKRSLKRKAWKSPVVGYLGQEKNRLEKSLSKSIEINKYAKTSVFKDVNGMEKNI